MPNKPTKIQQGLIARLQAAYRGLRGRDLNLRPEHGGPETSWEGSRKAAPSLDRFNREWYEPAERRALIAQFNELLADHPILSAALWTFAGGACAAGFTAQVVGATKGPLQAAIAQRIINRIKKRAKLESILPSIAFSLPTYGDVFLQPTIDPHGEVISVIQMPIAAMERKTDDRDQFIKPSRAFIQRDTSTLQIEAEFSIGQIIHARHMHTPGHRYGTSQIFSCRGVAKDAIDALRSLLPRRHANQPFRWYDLSAQENQPLTPFQFQQFRQNTDRKILRQYGEEGDPLNDIITTGAKLDVLGGDPQIGTLTDIEMLIDASLCTIGVSRQLIGWGTNINRDVLDEQRDQLYAAQMQFAKSLTEQILMPIFEIGLILQDINPDEIRIQIDYEQQFTDRQMEAKIDNARKDYVAGGISRRTYVKTVSSYYKIEDVEKEVAEIQMERGLAPPSANNMMQAKQAQNRAVQPPTAAAKTESGLARSVENPPRPMQRPGSVNNTAQGVKSFQNTQSTQSTQSTQKVGQSMQKPFAPATSNTPQNAQRSNISNTNSTNNVEPVKPDLKTGLTRTSVPATSPQWPIKKPLTSALDTTDTNQSLSEDENNENNESNENNSSKNSDE